MRDTPAGRYGPLGNIRVCRVPGYCTLQYPYPTLTTIIGSIDPTKAFVTSYSLSVAYEMRISSFCPTKSHQK